MTCKGSLSGWADFSPQVPTTQTPPFLVLGSYALEGGQIAHQYRGIVSSPHLHLVTTNPEEVTNCGACKRS
jgi:hypothetical protein